MERSREDLDLSFYFRRKKQRFAGLKRAGFARNFCFLRIIKMSIKHQLKAILVTEDGVNFLLLRELYVNDLRTGKLLDGKHYQGRTFILQEEDDEREQLPQEKE